ncbi:MAG: hypothetical protein ACOCV2_00705 [Persicimonas sp.]
MNRWIARNVSCLLLVAGLALLGATACSDEASVEENNDPAADDASDTTDEEDADAGGDEDADGGASDADDGGSGDDADLDGGDDGGGDTEDPDASDGGDAEIDGGDDAGQDAGDAGDAGADSGEVNCAYPPPEDSDCPDGDHGPGSFFNEFEIKESGECCKDFSGDGEDDSAVGDLAATVEGIMGVNFNDEIDQQIQDGDLVYLLEYADWRDPDDDSALDVWLYFGEDTDNDFQDNLNGNGDFYIASDSLDDNGDPRSDFPSASVTDGLFYVDDGEAPLMLPAGSDLAEVEVQGIELEADVESGADLEAGGRVELSNGELAAEVLLDDLFGAINDVAEQCSCIDRDSLPLYTEESSGWTCNATNDDANQCSGTGNPCEFFSEPSQCDLAAGFIEDEADLDTDNDGEVDALSLGATFEAVGAKIEGEAP